MTSARKDIITPDKDGMYHCISRCVRRAYLCGFDALTGNNYEHRKAWVRDRLMFLTTIFTLDILAYAIMSNHLHLLLRTVQASLDALTDEDVARRWLLLYPRRKNLNGTPCEPKEQEIQVLVRDRERIEKLRERLGDPSWFMKSLNEFLARKANHEDDCKGRFWEGRFKAIRIDSEAAALQCAIYIDLNPIRAKIAVTPEESLFTSAWERIEARSAKEQLKQYKCEYEARKDAAASTTTSTSHDDTLSRLEERAAIDSWLAPIERSGEGLGFLSITLDQYLTLLDWTGRQLCADKRGSIPAELSPILERLKLNSDCWVESMEQSRKWFYRFMGDVEAMSTAAAAAGKRWFKGMAAARRLFSTAPACP